jgi:hypothetical protein
VIRDGDTAISVAVMAHPSRAAAVRDMCDAHPELGISPVFDPEPGRGHSLRTALAAWSAVAPGATHHLVLQDDITLCRDLPARVAAAVRAYPDAAISLFAEWGSRTATMVRLALLRERAFAAVADPYTPTQALVLPAERARGLVAWARAETEPDDIVVHRYLRHSATRSIVTVPNLVEHDLKPSLTGNVFQGPRRSACFAEKRPDTSAQAGVAGEELTHVPGVSWMRLVAEWFACGPGAEPGFMGDPLTDRLPPAADPGTLRERFRDHLHRADPRHELRSALTDIVLYELWLSCFALGVIGGVRPETVRARADDPLWRTGLGTAFPGAFRRYLPIDTLDRHRDTAFLLCASAVEAGAEATTP